MAEFLHGNELNAQLEKIFENAEERIVLISPYIKLHDRFASVLQSKKSNPNIELILVFGKNEDDMSKSMRQEDFDFFKDFPNISIHYEKNLHAKYFANEERALLTSMNLYSYSQDNNIEFGVLTKGTRETLDHHAWDYFNRVIDQADLLYSKEPTFEKAGLFGLSSKYIGSTVKHDELSEFFSNRTKFDAADRKRKYKTPKLEAASTPKQGYCIRTGQAIPFNPKRPFCDKAYESWSKFKNDVYPEKYCHYSGELSNGETTYAKPILRKNWRAANGTK